MVTDDNPNRLRRVAGYSVPAHERPNNRRDTLRVARQIQQNIQDKLRGGRDAGPENILRALDRWRSAFAENRVAQRLGRLRSHAWKKKAGQFYNELSSFLHEYQDNGQANERRLTAAKRIGEFRYRLYELNLSMPGTILRQNTRGREERLALLFELDRGLENLSNVLFNQINREITRELSHENLRDVLQLIDSELLSLAADGYRSDRLMEIHKRLKTYTLETPEDGEQKLIKLITALRTEIIRTKDYFHKSFDELSRLIASAGNIMEEDNNEIRFFTENYYRESALLPLETVVNYTHRFLKGFDPNIKDFEIVSPIDEPVVGTLRILNDVNEAELTRIEPQDIVFIKKGIPPVDLFMKEGLLGVIIADDSAQLGHVEGQAESWRVALLRLNKKGFFDNYQEGMKIFLKADINGEADIHPATEQEIRSFGCRNKQGYTPEFYLPRPDLVNDKRIAIPLSDSKLNLNSVVSVGDKGAVQAELMKLGQKTGLFRVPDGFEIPFYVFYEFLQSPEMQETMNIIQTYLATGLIDMLPDDTTAYRQQGNETIAAIKNWITQQGIDQKYNSVIALLNQKNINKFPTKKNVLEKIRNGIIKGPLPSFVRSEILKAKQRINKAEPSTGFHVRTTTNLEDILGIPAEGIYESYENVKGDDKILEMVKHCWASVFNWKAFELRQRLGLPHWLRSGYDPNNPQQNIIVLPAVIVQDTILVDKEAISGTAYSYNRQNGSDDEIVINAVKGLNSAIVGERPSKPQEIIIRKSDGEILRNQPCENNFILVPNGTGGIREERAFPPYEALSEEKAKELANIVKVIQDHLGGVRQDIEWIYYRGVFYIVQARPRVKNGVTGVELTQPDISLAIEVPVIQHQVPHVVGPILLDQRLSQQIEQAA